MRRFITWASWRLRCVGAWLCMREPEPAERFTPPGESARELGFQVLPGPGIEIDTTSDPRACDRLVVGLDSGVPMPPMIIDGAGDSGRDLVAKVDAGRDLTPDESNRLARIAGTAAAWYGLPDATLTYSEVLAIRDRIEDDTAPLWPEDRAQIVRLCDSWERLRDERLRLSGLVSSPLCAACGARAGVTAHDGDALRCAACGALVVPERCGSCGTAPPQSIPGACHCGKLRTPPAHETGPAETPAPQPEPAQYGFGMPID